MYEIARRMPQLAKVVQASFFRVLSIASGLLFTLWAGRVLGPAGLGEITNLVVYASLIAVVGRWGQDYELLQLAATASRDVDERASIEAVAAAVLISFGCATCIGILLLPIAGGAAAVLGTLLSVLAALSGIAKGKAAFNWVIAAEVAIVCLLGIPLAYLLGIFGVELGAASTAVAIIVSAAMLALAVAIRTVAWVSQLFSTASSKLKHRFRLQFADGALMALTSGATYLAQSGLMVVPALVLTSTEVGIVRAAERGALALGMIFVLCEMVVQPTIARLGTDGRMAEMRKLSVRVSTILSAATIAAVAILWPFSGDIYLLVFGATFAASAKLFLIMSLGLVATAVIGPVGSYLAFSGRKAALSMATVAIAAITLPISFALTALFGMEGFAYSFAVACVVRSLVLGAVCKKMLGFIPSPFTRHHVVGV